MDANRPKLASHLSGVLLAAALLIALVGLWSGRRSPSADPIHRVIRAQIELIPLHCQIVELQIRIDRELRELDVRQRMRIEL